MVASQTRTQSRPDTLSERSVRSITNSLLDSMIKYPDQSVKLRRLETARIARRHRCGVMQVAGVRAALTSGRYGNLRELLRDRNR